ncbi:MAG: outer membrane protein assembly factor BamC [Planctomycetota bacterium]|jgi:outer membrane protein assembly factor BamC
MKFVFSISVVSLLILLSACSSGLDQRYLDVRLEANLEFPPDLIAPETESEFVLPEGISGDDPKQKNNIPVLAKISSLNIQGSNGFYWLSVEEPVASLYKSVKGFWGSEGYRLAMEEPVIGTMQTEWVYKEVGSIPQASNWFASLFQSANLSAIQDQFRTRIERRDDGSARIYIAHRGSAYSHSISKKNAADVKGGNEWRYRRPDPELEIEMLSRLMIYLGLQRKQVDEQLATAKLFNPRGQMKVNTDEGMPFLVLKDPYSLAWNRVYHQLDRLNFKILASNRSPELSSEGSITFNVDLVSESGKTGLVGLFNSQISEQQTWVIVIAEEDHQTSTVFLELENGDFNTSPEGRKFLSLLLEYLK